MTTATIASENAPLPVPPGAAVPHRSVAEQVGVAVRACRLRPRHWDEFAPETVHPANTSGFARVHLGLRVKPVWLEASVQGRKLAQWLVFRTRSWRPGRRGFVFSHCAPQIASESLHLRDKLLCAFTDHLRRTFDPGDMQVHNYALVRGLPADAWRKAGFRRIEAFASYVSTLAPDDELLASFHSTHRTATRRAIREGQLYCPDVSPREYIRLSRETYEPYGQSGPSGKLIQRIHRHMVPRGTALMTGVRVGGLLKVASIVLCGGRTGYYLHGASARQKDRFAGPYLQFENMRRLRDAGMHDYDFGGAKIGEGHSEKALSISEFKRKFGGRLIEAWGGSWQ